LLLFIAAPSRRWNGGAVINIFILLANSMQMKRILLKLRRPLTRFWYRVVTLQSSPHKVALGFALGVLISFTPTFGVQMALAAAIATLVRVNPLSAIVGVQLTNVFTVVPIYLMCYRVGLLLLGKSTGAVPAVDHAQSWSLWEMTRLGWDWIFTELVGAVFVGTFSAVVAYVFALWGVTRYRDMRARRKLERMSRRMAAKARDAARPPGQA
jgi:uncharacterized protein (DUF2062 family)